MTYKLPHELKKEFLTLYRHLLRETSYLPDSTARSFHRRHIVARFNQYRPKKLPAAEPGPWPATDASPIPSEERALSLLKRGKQTLNTLRRANHGYLGRLYGLLQEAYGRKGKRRHQLLAPLLEPEAPTDSAGLVEHMESKLKSANEAGGKLPIIPPTHTALIALAGSQRANTRNLESQSHVKRLEVIIPATNSWGRSMPQKRIANMKAKANRQLIGRLLPPLPQDEWERLRDLATGRAEWEGPITRRGVVSHCEPEDLKYKRRHGIKANPHTITPRVMRRLYQKLLLCTPMMEQHNGKWKVIWEKNHTVIPTFDAKRLDLGPIEP